MKYDFKRQADVIVINAGTNDASGTVTGLSKDEFMATLKTFLLDVRAKNPNAEIIYAYGMMSAGWTAQIKQVVEELRTAGVTHITYLQLKACSGKELGIASHPTADAYISRGDAIIELIEQLTGWKAGEEPVTEAPETTLEPETEAPAVTEAPAATDPAVTEPAPAEKKGCGASAISAAAVVGAVATAVALKKKRED